MPSPNRYRISDPDIVRARPEGRAIFDDVPEARSMQRRWRSSELLGTETEVEIEHGEAVYRLRLTALGKLILTK